MLIENIKFKLSENSIKKSFCLWGIYLASALIFFCFAKYVSKVWHVHYSEINRQNHVWGSRKKWPLWNSAFEKKEVNVMRYNLCCNFLFVPLSYGKNWYFFFIQWKLPTSINGFHCLIIPSFWPSNLYKSSKCVEEGIFHICQEIFHSFP